VVACNVSTELEIKYGKKKKSFLYKSSSVSFKLSNQSKINQAKNSAQWIFCISPGKTRCVMHTLPIMATV
jgi:hypothetical protein